MRLPDGRRERFTEPGEARAAERAKALLQKETPTVSMPLDLELAGGAKNLLDAAGRVWAPPKFKMRIGTTPAGETYSKVVGEFDAEMFWNAVRRELLERPAYAARVRAGRPPREGVD